MCRRDIETPAYYDGAIGAFEKEIKVLLDGTRNLDMRSQQWSKLLRDYEIVLEENRRLREKLEESELT